LYLVVGKFSYQVSTKEKGVNCLGQRPPSVDFIASSNFLSAVFQSGRLTSWGGIDTTVFSSAGANAQQTISTVCHVSRPLREGESSPKRDTSPSSFHHMKGRRGMKRKSLGIEADMKRGEGEGEGQEERMRMRESKISTSRQFFF
jgi:hypothetical protein